jgi:hypothetical protein
MRWIPAAILILGSFSAGCSSFHAIPLSTAETPGPPSLLGKEIRAQLTDGRLLTFIVTRESADSLWASQSLTTPPGPAVARAEIVALEVDRIDWLGTGKSLGVLAVVSALAVLLVARNFDPT